MIFYGDLNMKKIYVVIFSFCLIAIFCSCGNQSAIKQAQQRVVEIGEKYLNYELTKDEAKELLDSIVVPETQGNGQLYLESDIAALSFAITKQNASYEDIYEKVDYIKNRTYE